MSETLRNNLAPKRAMAFVFFVILIDAMGMGLILPVLPGLIRDLSGSNISHSATIAGFLLFSFSIMQFIFAPILSGLSDSIGRRPILLLSLLGLALDYLVMYASFSLQMLFIARLISGLLASTIPAASACIADISSKQERARLFGIAGAAIGSGYTLGPLLGGVTGEIDARLPFALASLLCFLALIYGWFALPETLDPQHRRQFRLKRANPFGALLSISKYPAVLLVAASVFVVQLAGHSIGSVWPFFAAEVVNWGALDIGLSAGLYGFMIILIQGVLLGSVVRRLGEARTVVFSLLVGILTYWGISTVSSPYEIYFWIVVASFSQFAFPAMQSLMTAQIPDDSQGELQGALASLFSISLVIGPVVMTQIFSYFTKTKTLYVPGAPFVFSAILMALALLLFSVSSKQIGQK